MIKLLLMWVMLVLMCCSSGAAAEGQYAALTSNREVYAFVRRYAHSLINKDLQTYYTVLNQGVIAYFDDKHIVVRGNRVLFLHYLLMLESSDVSSIIKAVISEPDSVQYRIADFGSVPGYFNKQLTIDAYNIEGDSLKELCIIRAGSPNHRYIISITYSNGEISKVVSADMLERQEKIVNYFE